MSSELGPWRTGMPHRPAVPAPPAVMPMARGGRPLKRWRYVGVFTEDVLLCAAIAHVGPVPVAWWAVWDREQRTLAERTVRSRRRVTVERGKVQVADGSVEIDLALEEDEGVETISPHGSEYAWTRKQGGVPVRGRIKVLERELEVDGRAIVDESAGYHARHTAWFWSAGVGRSAGGAEIAWNLVSGLHDDPAASERTVWVDGTPHHVGPATFAADLGSVDVDGAALTFTAEATRRREERLLLFRSSYEQPFGSFAGALPVAGELAQGFGVMERHDVTW
jgi:hypothetical protein